MIALAALSMFALAAPSANAAPPALTFSTYAALYPKPAFFDHNNDAFLARLKMLDSLPKGSKAEIATLAFDNGVVTRTLARHLCRARKNGVQIDLLTDSKSGSVAGRVNAFNGTDDAATQEEIYQYLANCGVRVHIHNEIQDFVIALGSHLPNFFSDPNKNGHSVFPLSVLFRVNAVTSKLGALADWATGSSGITAKSNGLLTNLRDFALNVKDVVGKGDSFPTGTSADDASSAAAKATAAWDNLIKDPIWDEATGPQLKNTLDLLSKQIFADPDLAPTFQSIRHFNRLNHRKLFLVEAPNGAGCFFLGGRNLGDFYLTEQDTSYFDGDLLLCTHQGADAKQAYDDAKKSFADLLTNKADAFFRLPNADVQIVDIPVRQDYQYKLLFQAPGSGSTTPAAYLKTANTIQPAGSHEVLPSIAWPDAKRVEPSLELPDGSQGFKLLVSGFDPKQDQVKSRFLALLARETKEVYLETPYAVFDSDMRSAIEAALKRGISIHIVTNGFFTSDGSSKLAAILMSPWYQAMEKLYPSVFDIKMTSAHTTHMTHFKFAAFACQPGGAPGGFSRSFILGSHNFHPRSGNSDKEHAITWSTGAGDCQPVASDPLVASRYQMYKSFPTKDGATVLEHYPRVEDEVLKMHLGGFDGGGDLKLANHKALADNTIQILYWTGERTNGDTGIGVRQGDRFYHVLLPKFEAGGIYDLLAQLF